MWRFLLLLLLRNGWCELLTNPVDLGYDYHEGTVTWRNDRQFGFSSKTAEIKPDGTWYAANEFCVAEHAGTHFDAPYHFAKKGWKVADVPLHRLIGQGVCINLIKETIRHGANASLEEYHIKDWEREHGKIRPGSIVLVNFGWSTRYGTREYMNEDKDGVFHFPGISAVAAQLLTQRGIFGVGVDAASLDAGPSETMESHRTFSENSIYGLENLRIPSYFPEIGFTLIVMPMKIKEGTGAPARVIAVPITDTLIPQVLEYASSTGLTPWYYHSYLVLCSIFIVIMYSMNVLALWTA